jgi:hypothetical protein
MKDDMKDMKWMKMKHMHRQLKTDILMSISFSVFGMLLIFGLGFVFPSINPYVVIKWIIIVAGVVFLFSFIKYVVYCVMKMKMKMMMKGEWKEKKSSRK